MTMPAWPFALVHPAGYADGLVPNGAELQLLQQQVAVAADGRVWTDIAAVRNNRYTNVILPPSLSQRTLIRDPKSRRWLVFGGTAGTVNWTVSGSRWLGGSAALGGMGSIMAYVTAAAANSAGVILVGGAPSVPATDKLRESTDGGDTWILRNIGGVNAQSINAIVYSESLALWLCSVGGVGGDGIYSSPDRVTWTARAAAGAPPLQLVLRESPTPIILGTCPIIGGGSTNYYRSVNGTTWTTESFPVTVTISPSQGCWSDALGAFFIGGGDGIYTSTTGLTGSWTRIDTTWPTPGTSSSIAAFGRLLLRGDGKASVDGGVSWFQVLESTRTDLFVTATSFGVAWACGQAGLTDVYIGQQIGF
jgi:hypothetical protein